jgi:hypothetical protein
MMIFFKAFLIISLLSVPSIHSDSYENTYEPLINCDALYGVYNDLSDFIIRHELQLDYDRRNDNYETCFYFLNKLSLFLDNYQNQKVENNMNKRAYPKKHKSIMSFKYWSKLSD